MIALWAWLGRIAYYVGGVVALPIFLHKTSRVKVGIYDPDTKQLLLSKTWISAQRWNVVGGGIHKDEDKFVAAIREVKEETGINLATDELQYIAKIAESEYMATYTSHVFLVERPVTDLTKQRFEILELKWFPVSKLPRNSNRAVLEALQIPLKNRG